MGKYSQPESAHGASIDTIYYRQGTTRMFLEYIITERVEKISDGVVKYQGVETIKEV